MGCTASSPSANAASPKKAAASPIKSPGKANGTRANPVAQPPPKKVEIPHTFDARYQRGKILGTGAYSEAVEVTSKIAILNKEKKYACKITKKEGQAPEDIDAIKREIEILKKLNHPSIVGCIDNFEDAEAFYVILELCDGGELFDRIVEKSAYSELEARNLFITITRGIKFLHEHDIVHRDLKPENLLLENRNDDIKVKIADFGFAKIASEPTGLSTMCGSPNYVAPEILNHAKYGKPVDMWALGVITYILLAGYPPFSDDSQQAMYEKIKRGQYTFDLEYWDHITKEAKDLIRGLLTVDPTKRLTADQALTHKWVGITAEELAGINLDANLRELKKFNANRKFKAAARAVIAINKMNHLLGKSGKSV